MLTETSDNIEIEPHEKSLQNDDKSVDHPANRKDEAKKIRREWKH